MHRVYQLPCHNCTPVQLFSLPTQTFFHHHYVFFIFIHQSSVSVFVFDVDLDPVHHFDTKHGIIMYACPMSNIVLINTFCYCDFFYYCEGCSLSIEHGCFWLDCFGMYHFLYSLTLDIRIMDLRPRMVFLALSGTIFTYVRKFQYQTLKKVMHQLRIMIILMPGVSLYL